MAFLDEFREAASKKDIGLQTRLILTYYEACKWKNEACLETQFCPDCKFNGENEGVKNI